MKAYKHVAVVFVIGLTLVAALIGCLEFEGASAAAPAASPSTANAVSAQPLAPLQAAIRVTKTVALDPVSCSQLSQIQVSPGTDIYFCITIENSGTVTLTDHLVSDSLLSAPVSVMYPLLPGEIISMTDAVLTVIGLPDLLGPIPVEAGTLTNTVNVTSSNPAVTGTVATAAATAEVNAVPTAIDDIDEPIMPQLEPSCFVPAVWQ